MQIQIVQLHLFEKPQSKSRVAHWTCKPCHARGNLVHRRIQKDTFFTQRITLSSVALVLFFNGSAGL